MRKNLVSIVITISIHILIFLLVKISPSKLESKSVEINFVKIRKVKQIANPKINEQKENVTIKEKSKTNYFVPTVHRSDFSYKSSIESDKKFAKENILTEQEFKKNEKNPMTADFRFENSNNTEVDDVFLENEPFSISWQSENREILLKILPKYPENLNINAYVRLKFLVNKEGFVTQIVPLQKGSPELEKLSLNALNDWIFAPSTNEVWGVIVFRYLLK